MSERLYYAANPTVGAGHTFSNSGSSNFSSLCVMAFSGAATTSVFDQENGATNTAATIQPGSITPSSDNSLVVSGLAWNATRSLFPPTLDSGFTVATSSNFLSGNHYGCSIGYLAQATSSAVNPTWNLGNSSPNAARIASFKPAEAAVAGTTTIRYVHADNLGGANVVTDSSGNVVESLDYYPYGSIRIDNSTANFDEKRKYIGEVHDDSTGLNYLNARYQDPARGQFLSEDPIFNGDPNAQDLANPQNLNSYSYSLDNPINKSDPSGKYVYEISRPVSGSGFLNQFSHAFTYVVPQPGENLAPINGSNMSINTSQPFTLGAYPSGPFPPHLTYSADNSYDYGIASANMSVPGVSRQLVSPPQGMTSAQFDASVVNSYNRLSPDQGIYDPLGLRRQIGLSNSNNANTSLMMSSGVSQMQMNGLTSSLYASNQRPAPGLGVSLSAPTYAQSVLSTLSSVLQAASAILTSLSKSR